MDWHRERDELNYRRFFAVSTLAAIRVEVPWVFDESHVEIVRWITSGIADGIRVDHPDGLADPGGYLDTLAAATGGTSVWVEKILEGEERLPAFWATEGTTGYDALADLDRVLVDPAGRSALDALAHPTARARTARGLRNADPRNQARYRRRHPALRGVASRPVNCRRCPSLSTGGPSKDSLPKGNSPTPWLSSWPVSRSTAPTFPWARSTSRRRQRSHATIAPNSLPRSIRCCPFCRIRASRPLIRFQQTSGMVMAKGVEDTAFYRDNRLSSLTEVGADPAEFSIDVAEFHRRQESRQATYPASLTTLSTHDTKRGEDTRARISVLSELPAEWEETLGYLRERAPLGDGALENLLWESIVGAWPASRERLHDYAEKAAREAGSSTNWLQPNTEFETRMHALVDSAFDDAEVAGRLDRFVGDIRQAGVVQLADRKTRPAGVPGVPDVYQGSELWETSLVDPGQPTPGRFRHPSSVPRSHRGWSPSAYR